MFSHALQQQQQLQRHPAVTAPAVNNAWGPWIRYLMVNPFYLAPPAVYPSGLIPSVDPRAFVPMATALMPGACSGGYAAKRTATRATTPSRPTAAAARTPPSPSLCPPVVTPASPSAPAPAPHRPMRKARRRTRQASVQNHQPGAAPACPSVPPRRPAGRRAPRAQSPISPPPPPSAPTMSLAETHKAPRLSVSLVPAPVQWLPLDPSSFPPPLKANPRQKRAMDSDGPPSLQDFDDPSLPPEKRQRTEINPVFMKFANDLYLLHGWTEEGARKMTGIIPSGIRSHVKYLRKIGWGKKVEPAKDDVHSYEAFRRRLGSQVREDVIFFPDRPPYPNESRNVLFSTLSSVTKSLDICIWNISCEALVDLIIDIHKRENRLGERAVKVRVVTDSDQSGMWYSRVEVLRDAGILVKIRGGYRRDTQHDRFVVVDNKLLL